MKAGISSIGFTSRLDLQYQKHLSNSTQKSVSQESIKVMESSVVKLIRLMGLGKNVDVKA